MSKIAFFDIDGTLFWPGIGIPDSAKRAVDQLIKNGHKAVICTGRSRGMVPESYFHMGFHGVICGAGTYVEYEGNVLHHDQMTNDEIKKVIEWGRKEKVGIILEGDENGYYDSKNCDETYETMRKKTEHNCETILQPLEEAVHIPKWTYHYLKPEKKYEIEEILGNRYTGIYHEPEDAVEFMPAGINKATGIACILENCGIGREDAYAFGDSVNDMEMIRYVKYGVAMGNAVPELLKEAPYKTARADEDGIALALKKFELI